MRNRLASALVAAGLLGGAVVATNGFPESREPTVPLAGRERVDLELDGCAQVMFVNANASRIGPQHPIAAVRPGAAPAPNEQLVEVRVSERESIVYLERDGRRVEGWRLFGGAGWAWQPVEIHTLSACPRGSEEEILTEAGNARSIPGA